MAKTKIIATLGPASTTQAVIQKMMIAGLDVVRLNFSHGTHNEHINRINLIRNLNKKMRRSIKIMQDLEGYRIRIGALKEPIKLMKGHSFYLVQGNFTGTKENVPFDYRGCFKNIKKDTLIYIDDGKISLSVNKIEAKKLRVSVINGGILKEHKGVQIIGAKLDFRAITEKDKKDLEVAIRYKLDYIAQSFVRNRKDIEMLRKLVYSKHPKCQIFAKIENREAVNNIEEIIDASDGIIIARGDLGVCVPIYEVPIIQKEIIKKCITKRKPVVVATQMLDSMVEESLPTRAEVSDVANAILDGANYLLLSAETAVGKHPHKVIEVMNKIIKYTEKHKIML